MSGRRFRLPLLLALLVFPALPVLGGDGDGTRAGLQPIGLGRAATLPPVTTGRAATLPPVTTGRAATLPSATRGRAAGLRPVTTGRAAGLRPVTTGRAAGLAPVTVDRAAGLAPVTVDRAAGLAPVTVDRAAGLAPVTADRAAGLAPVTVDRAAGLAPVTVDRAAGLSSVSLDRAAALRSAILDEDGARVLLFEDGYVAPYRVRRRVSSGFFSRTLRCTEQSPWGSSSYQRRVTESFRHEGLTAPLFLDGRVRTALDAIDPWGPQHLFHRPLGKNVPEGVHDGRFYFPAAYFLRPLRHGDGAYNKGWRAILVPADVEEVVPDDFDRTLRKSHFPLAIGDMAFKAGDYVQAALAFRDGVERRPDTAAAHFALGDALTALENYGYAADEIKAGLSLAPKWADHLDRRGVFGVPGDQKKELAAVGKFLSDHGQSAAGWFLLGYLRMTSGDPALRGTAAEAFRHALDLDPEDAVALRYVHLLDREVPAPDPANR